MMAKQTIAERIGNIKATAPPAAACRRPGNPSVPLAERRTLRTPRDFDRTPR